MIARLKSKMTRAGLHLCAPLLRYLNQVPYDFPADPKAVLKIKLADIDFFLEDNIARQKSIPGMIVNRRWEPNMTPARYIFSVSLKNKGLKEHFEEGVPWIKTSLFQERYARLLKNGRKVRGCRTLSQLEGYYRKYDDLYRELRENGICVGSDAKKIEPIYIHIGPEGEIMFTSNGNHRLYIARILEIREFPVMVWWRHERWQRKRDECFRLGKSQFFEIYPNLKNHPDLQDVPDR